jgi:hypothetical protein
MLYDDMVQMWQRAERPERYRGELGSELERVKMEVGVMG